MNQFQIIKRDKTRRDEKKMETQTGWRGRGERLSSSPTWLLYLVSSSLRLYKRQTWCELCQPVCIYCLARVEVQWMEVGCESFSTGALAFLWRCTQATLWSKSLPISQLEPLWNNMEVWHSFCPLRFHQCSSAWCDSCSSVCSEICSLVCSEICSEICGARSALSCQSTHQRV